MRLSRREIFWLVLLPCGLGVATAVGAAFDLVGGTVSAVVWAVAAGLAGFMLFPLLHAYAPKGNGGRPAPLTFHCPKRETRRLARERADPLRRGHG